MQSGGKRHGCKKVSKKCFFGRDKSIVNSIYIYIADTNDNGALN